MEQQSGNQEITQQKIAVAGQPSTSEGSDPKQERPDQLVQVSVKSKKHVFIVVGILMLILVGAGIGIGMSIVLASNYSVINKVHIEGGDCTTQLTEVQDQQSQGLYRIYATRKIASPSRRLLTRHQKKDQVDVHLVFGNQSDVVITIHANSTFKVHINSEALAKQLVKHNSAFQEYIAQNANNSSALSQQTYLFMRAIVNQLFSAVSNQSVDFEVKHLTKYKLNHKLGKFQSQNSRSQQNPRRLLWGWSDTFSGISAGAAVYGLFASSLYSEVNKQVSANQTQPDIHIKPSENSQTKIDECIPLSSQEISCQAQTNTSKPYLVSK